MAYIYKGVKAEGGRRKERGGKRRWKDERKEGKEGERGKKESHIENG